MSRVKGSYFTVSKAGLSDVTETFPVNSVLRSPLWGLGFDQFLQNMQPYIDRNCINISLHLILSNKVDEPTVIL
jgi:hypothetical protein